MSNNDRASRKWVDGELLEERLHNICKNTCQYAKKGDRPNVMCPLCWLDDIYESINKLAVEKVDAIPPVPHEMTAREYFKEKARMKATLLKECKKRIQCREPNCRICQWSYRDRVPDGNFERENPQQAIAIVERWAHEHPEENDE